MSLRLCSPSFELWCDDMKKLLYFDPFNGVSGDMILGALVDLGLPLDHLQAEINKLEGISVRLSAEPIERQGLYGINFHVEETPVEPEHNQHNHGHGNSHGHHHHHAHRGFQEIRRMIQASDLDPWVKEKSIAIFRRLGEAEAKVHRSSLQEVHFHEVGAVDSIVDIVGACIGFRYFEVERFLTSPLNLGGGTVTFSHGTWPVPAPATTELVQGFPVSSSGSDGELTTPTGAAIVTTLADQPGTPVTYRVDRSGFGAGDRRLPNIPNMLRLVLALLPDSPEPSARHIPSGVEEEVYLLESAIDDMDGQAFGYLMDLALKKGALDVYFTSIQMKKNRPGVLLSVLCRPSDLNEMAELIFRETTTLGIRWIPWKRWVLQRETRQVQTEYGAVRVKIGRSQGRIVNITPEYEDVKALSEETGLPLKLIRQKTLELVGKIEP